MVPVLSAWHTAGIAAFNSRSIEASNVFDRRTRIASAR